MQVTIKNWGKMPDGQTTKLYTIKNDHMEFTISDLGGIITSILAPDKNGVFGEVCLGYDTVDDYLADNAYVGAMVGRYSNRTAKGRLVINGVEYQLTQNEGETHLHGGGVWNKKLWQTEVLENGVLLSYHSPDGECGYPGNVDAYIKVTLEGKQIIMDFKAVADKDYYLSLTNHAYFNLRGAGEGNVLSHQIIINANKYTPLAGTEQIPTGEIADATGTQNDFTELKEIKYDNHDLNYILNSGNLAAEVVEPVSGRVLKVITDLPCIQFYTAEKMTEHKGRNGQIYGKNSGFCLEPQYYPNACNIPAFPSGFKLAGEEYEHVIIFEFDTK